MGGGGKEDCGNLGGGGNLLTLVALAGGAGGAGGGGGNMGSGGGGGRLSNEGGGGGKDVWLARPFKKTNQIDIQVQFKQLSSDLHSCEKVVCLIVLIYIFYSIYFLKILADNIILTK